MHQKKKATAWRGNNKGGASYKTNFGELLGIIELQPCFPRAVAEPMESNVSKVVMIDSSHGNSNGQAESTALRKPDNNGFSFATTLR